MIFANVTDTDKNKKAVPNTLYSVDWNQFIKFDTDKVELPPVGTFFNFSHFGGGEINLVASKKSVNLMLLSNKRHKKSLKLLAPLDYTTIPSGSVYAIVKPHKYYYAKKPKSANKRFVLNLLTGDFNLLTYAEYCAEGFSSFPKGVIIRKDDDNWKKVLKTPKISQDMNETAVHEVVELVSEKISDWVNKDRYFAKCEKCKNSCKQSLDITGLYCRKYEPIVERKKREYVSREKKPAAYKRPPKVAKVEIVDTGTIIAEEIKRRFSKNG